MSYLSGAILIILAGVAWSTQGLIIRLIPDTGSWAILFWRSAGMLPVLAIVAATTAAPALACSPIVIDKPDQIRAAARAAYRDASAIIDRQLAHFDKADPGYGASVREALAGKAAEAAE